MIHPRVTPAALDLVKGFEGFRSSAAALPHGGWVIGYGHTLTAREGAVVSEADAAALLLYDLSRTARGVEAALLAPVGQPQFEALVSFAFNVGPQAFAASSVVKRVNEGAYLQAAAALELWRRAEFDGDALVVDALVRRRAAEKAHFLRPPAGFSPAPSPLIRPLFDHAAAAVAPGDLVRARTALESVTFEGDSARAIARLGEPAPSALVAAADALRARLDAILADRAAPPPRAVKPPPPPPMGDMAASGPLPTAHPPVAPDAIEDAPPEPQVAPAPAPTPALSAPPRAPSPSAEPVDTAPPAAEPEPEPPPFIGWAPQAEAEPPRVAPQVEPEPLAGDEAGFPQPAPAVGDDASPSSAPMRDAFVAEDDPALADLPSEVLAPDAPPRRDWLREETGGRRRWRGVAEHPLLFTALGAAGAVMFVCALAGVLTQRPALGALVLGLAGVALMAPAAAWILSRRLGRAPRERRSRS